MNSAEGRHSSRTVLRLDRMWTEIKPHDLLPKEGDLISLRKQVLAFVHLLHVLKQHRDTLI